MDFDALSAASAGRTAVMAALVCLVCDDDDDEIRQNGDPVEGKGVLIDAGVQIVGTFSPQYSALLPGCLTSHHHRVVII